LLPGILSIGGAKWYSSTYMFRQMDDQGVGDYFRKSKKLDGDLRKVENYIKQRNLIEKGSK
jgi:hypothetical protein